LLLAHMIPSARPVSGNNGVKYILSLYPMTVAFGSEPSRGYHNVHVAAVGLSSRLCS